MKPMLLIIDDDEDMINILTINLKKEFQVHKEMTGSNAINTAFAVKPKVVLLDLHMPNVDGYEVLMQFRNHPSTSNLPVICMSADTSDSARDRAYSLGAVGFIKKPPNLKLIAQDVHSFLNTINPKLESVDKKCQFTIAFNEDEKAFLLQNAINTYQNEMQKVILLSWKEGSEFFKNYETKGIDDETVIFLKIKPSLITKFPYMQELTPIISDIKNYLKSDSSNFHILIDEPALLFGQQDTSNATAKIFALNELLSKSFKTIACFATKQRDPYKDSFLLGLAKSFVGNTN